MKSTFQKNIGQNSGNYYTWPVWAPKANGGVWEAEKKKQRRFFHKLFWKSLLYVLKKSDWKNKGYLPTTSFLKITPLYWNRNTGSVGGSSMYWQEKRLIQHNVFNKQSTVETKFPLFPNDLIFPLFPWFQTFLTKTTKPNTSLDSSSQAKNRSMWNRLFKKNWSKLGQQLDLFEITRLTEAYEKLKKRNQRRFLHILF